MYVTIVMKEDGFHFIDPPRISSYFHYSKPFERFIHTTFTLHFHSCLDQQSTNIKSTKQTIQTCCVYSSTGWATCNPVASSTLIARPLPILTDTTLCGIADGD